MKQKHPTELRRGDKVGTAKSGYTCLSDATKTGNTVSVKVIHHPDGGHDIRQWSLKEIKKAKTVPVYGRDKEML